MKRTITTLLALVLLTGMQPMVDAAEQAERQEQAMKVKEAIQIAYLKPDVEAVLKNSAKYDASLQDCDFSSSKFIPIYSGIFWNLFGQGIPVQQIVQKINSGECDSFVYYVTLYKDDLLPIKIQDKDGQQIIVNITKPYAEDNQLSWLRDLLSSDNILQINGEKAFIQDVYCFDDHTSFAGIVVYLLTDKGTYISYYDMPKSEPVLMSEAEFTPCAKRYYDKMIESAYDENGDPTGGNLSFLDFIGDAEIQNPIQGQKQDNRTALILGIAGGCLLLGCGVAAAILITRKRKRKG